MIRNWVRKRAESVSNRRQKIQMDRLRRRNNLSFLASIPEEPEYTNNKTKSLQQQQQQQQRRVGTNTPTGPTSLSVPESPPRSSSLAGDASLPPAWQSFVDTHSGRPYYFNSLTGVTQWQHPVVTTPPGPSATTNNHPHNISNHHSDSSLRSDERHRQSSNHATHINANPSNHTTPVKKNIGEHLNAIFGGLLRRSASASTSPNPNNQRTSYPPSSTITAGNGVGGRGMSSTSVSLKETVPHISPESHVRQTHSAHGAIAISSMNDLHPPTNHHQNQPPPDGQGLSPSESWEVRGKETHISSSTDDENSNTNAVMLLQQRSAENDGHGLGNAQEQGLVPSALSPLTIPTLSPSRKHSHPVDGDEAAAVTTNTRPKSADLPQSPIASSSLHDTSSPKVLSRHFSWTAHINNSKGPAADPINIVPRHQLKAALARTLLGGSSDCLDSVSPRPGILYPPKLYLPTRSSTSVYTASVCASIAIVRSHSIDH